jgi:hypothetical protein
MATSCHNVTMELTDARAYLDVIKAEEQRRAQLLPDHPDAAYDRWFFYDAPFINELCIVFLVALRHHIERRLIFLAACAADGGRPITKEEFLARVKELSNLKASARWDEISGRLTPDRCAHYHVIEALRHLANAYKHDPSLEPDDRLRLCEQPCFERVCPASGPQQGSQPRSPCHDVK